MVLACYLYTYLTSLSLPHCVGWNFTSVIQVLLVCCLQPACSDELTSSSTISLATSHQLNPQLTLLTDVWRTLLRQMRKNHLTLVGTSIYWLFFLSFWNKHLTWYILWTTDYFLWITLIPLNIQSCLWRTMF